jgi:predicted dehydrogenase
MSAAQPAATSHETRRGFLKKSSAAIAAGGLAGSLMLSKSAHAAGSDEIKIALIGCGGRGSGAANEALNADKNVKLVAMGDAFQDRLDSSKNSLAKRWGDRVDVPAERSFTGFDAYKKVLACDVDVVLLATPPHFRPEQFKACIEAGKHVFCEKPVAVDAPGVRSVLETSQLAKQKNLFVVSGLCWRYDFGARETMKRVLGGEIGDLVAIQENYNASPLWHHDRREGWSDMEYQVRNWLYYTWLSGDHIVEQHVHSLDKAVWAMGDNVPDETTATALGGRQVRTEPQWGHIYDHFAVNYNFPSGVRVYSYTRQMAGCSQDVEDYMLGTKGQANVIAHQLFDRSGKQTWQYSGPSPQMHQQEHNELFASLRSGDYINNGHYMAISTMFAIFGRMAAYTGDTLKWKDALASSENLTPKNYEWRSLDVPQVAMPGINLPFQGSGRTS